MYKTSGKFINPSGRISSKIIKSSNGYGPCNCAANKKAKIPLIDLSKIVLDAVLYGIVTKIEDYGAFVDLGGVNGLLHISEMTDKRINHPNEILHIDQKIKTTIIKIEQINGKYKIALSMKPSKGELNESKQNKQNKNEAENKLSKGFGKHGDGCNQKCLFPSKLKKST